MLTIVFFSSFLILLFFNYQMLAFVGAALTLPFVISLITVQIFRDSNRALRYDPGLSIKYIFIVTTVLASFGIAGLILYLSNSSFPGAIDRHPYTIYQELLSLSTPAIMALLIFCIPTKIISNAFINKIEKSKRRKLAQKRSLIYDTTVVRIPTKKLVIYIALSVILGTVIALLPHLAVINPNQERLGVDAPRYVQWLKAMQSQSSTPIQATFKDLSFGDRPLTLIILYIITEITKAEPFLVVEYSPAFLTPLIILATTFLTRQLTANDKIAIIAAFLTAISFQTLAGIYSGFYANWLALVFGYLAFGLLIKFLKMPSRLTIVLLAVTMSALVLAHVYTWTIMLSVGFVFLSVLLLLNYYPRKRILLIYLVLSSSIAVDILKSSVTGSSSGLDADVSLGKKGLGIGQFSERLKTLADTVQTYYGGIYANIAILGLGLYWLIRCSSRHLASIFLLIFMSSALIPLFIGDWVLQSRVLYEIPFQIPAAIALLFIWKEDQKIIAVGMILIAFYLSLHVLVNLGFVASANPLSLSGITP